MSMNPLPPQAYTKDTLVKAYQWIQLQPPSIKELATTPDVLVSLFLKAKLQGESALERPSIQNFKSELKSLAGQLGEFDTTKEKVDASIALNGTLPNPSEFADFKSYAPQSTAGFAGTSTNSPVGATTWSSTTPEKALGSSTPEFTPRGSSSNDRPEATSSARPPAQSVSLPSRLALDSKSQAMVDEIKLLSNLDSDTEALKMLIAVGYKQLKNLLR